MKLNCPKCNKEIPGENISVKDGYAQCDSCHGVYSLKELDKKTAYTHYDQKLQPQISLPKGMEQKKEFNKMTISRRWFGFTAFFLVFFTAIWNGFLGGMVFVALSEGIFIILAGAAIHFIVGIFLIYITIANFINKTVIEVNGSELNIFHTPLPWMGKKTISKGNTKQFYGKKRISHSTSDHRTSVHYELRMMTLDDRDFKVLGGLSDPEQILFLEQEIESYWSIRDEQVEGELK
ncbi:hypothetical protein [Spirochaeta cellobiosiphila]|uniref:hypothetical protein n=1 Tax=Spirochaeta cellobiosiphila TaxID=504483 RepID=UPI00041F940A|nr:hypothetical protein [Spirochaeta cellobiosiphila]